MDKRSVEAVLSRLMKALSANSESELGRMLGVNRQTLSSWKGRGRVPYALCIQLASERGWSLDWLLTGEERQGRKVMEPHAEYLSDREREMLDLFNSLDEAAQREVQATAEEKKRVQAIEKQLKALAAKLDQYHSAG